MAGQRRWPDSRPGRAGGRRCDADPARPYGAGHAGLHAALNRRAVVRCSMPGRRRQPGRACPYDMLSADSPFEGQVASILHRVIHEEPPPPRSLCRSPARSGNDLPRSTREGAIAPLRNGRGAGRRSATLSRRTFRALGVSDRWDDRCSGAGVIRPVTVATVPCDYRRCRRWLCADRAGARPLPRRARLCRVQPLPRPGRRSDGAVVMRDTGWWWHCSGQHRESCPARGGRRMSRSCATWPSSAWAATSLPAAAVAVDRSRRAIARFGRDADARLVATATRDAVTVWTLPEGQPAAVLKVRIDHVPGPSAGWYAPGRRLRRRQRATAAGVAA